MDDVSFLGQKDTSNKITDLGTSNRLGGTIHSSVSTLLSFCVNVLITLSINCIGLLAAVNLLLIRGNSLLKSEVIFLAWCNSV